jgi:hypothetical protein
MSLKINFLNSHLDFSPENLGAVSEEQGERFHLDIKDMERGYQGQWNVNTIGYCCWTIHRKTPETSHKRKRNMRSFASKRKNSTRPLNKV